VQELEVGFERQLPTLDEQGREQVDLTPILWTQEHWKAEHPFLLPVEAGANTAQVVSEDAQPGSEAPAVNLDQLVIAVNVQYRIADVATYGYGQRYSYESPRELLEALCNRVVLHYASTHDLNTVLGPGRQATVQALQGEIQSEANRYELGVEVTFVGMVAVHPPIEVADAFEKVISAVQDKQASILKARGEANATVAQAQGQREVTVAQAQAYKTQRSLVAKAESQRFGQQVEAYVAGGSVYVEREYLSVLDEMLGGMRKYVLGSERAGDFVFEVDLKEKLEPDFFRELGTGAQTQER